MNNNFSDKNLMMHNSQVYNTPKNINVIDCLQKIL